MTEQVLDHKRFVASLSNEQKSELTQRSTRAGAGHLLAYVIALTVLMVIYLSLPYGFVMALPLGIMLVFLFTLLHESVHRTPFAQDWLNDIVARLCGLIIFLPADWFRFFHFAHHRHTNIRGKDPELASPKPSTWGQYLWIISGLPVWYFHFKTLLVNAFSPPHYDYVPASGYARIKREARIALIIYLCLFAVSVYVQSWLLVQVWLIPMLIGQPFLRLYLMAEHGDCPEVPNMLENSRTLLTNPLVRFIAWNMPYHTEHHTYPTVPFYRLPELHQFIKTHIKNLNKGYSEFHVNYQKNF